MPQFWQATTTVVFWSWFWRAATSMGIGSSAAGSLAHLDEEAIFWFCNTLRLAALDTRLLKAGHPLQPSAPPVPLQRPPPGHVPVGI